MSATGEELRFIDPSRRFGIASTKSENNNGFFRYSSTELAVAFTGRITNHTKLASESLKEGGNPNPGFAELAARLYLRYGFDFIDRLQGHFSIIIWDGKQEQLLAFRDQAGFLPLFYALSDGRIRAVASSIKPLVYSGIVPTSYDRRAINYFICDKAFTDEDTPFEAIRALGAGEALIIKKAEWRKKRYYHIPISKKPMSEREAVDRADKLLASLLEEYTRNFDRIGLLLSGGVDSMLLLSALKKVTDKPLLTYSISVKTGATDNEYVEKASRYFGTRHTDIYLDESTFHSHLTDLIKSYPTPAAGAWHIYLGTLAAGRDGVRGVLAGFGGELVFGIPPAYRYFEKLHNLFGSLDPRKPFHENLLKLQGKVGSLLSGVIPQAGLLSGYSDLRRGIWSWLGSRLQEPRVHRLFLSSEEKFPPVRDKYLRDYAESNADNLTDTLLYSRLKNFEGNKVLGKCNGIARINKVELLMPFMDRRMVEFGFSIPHRLKRTGGRYRHLEHKLAERYHDFERDKSAFIVPFSDWLRSDPPQEAETAFEPERIRKKGIFNDRKLRGLWEEFLQGDPSITWADIFVFISLDIWLEEVMKG